MLLLIQSSMASAELVYQVGCRLFDLEGNLLHVQSGMMCKFFTDGDLLKITTTTIEYIDSSQKIKWKRYGNFHHQYKINKEKDKLYILSASVHDVFEVNARFDTVMILDLKSGKLIHELDLYDYHGHFLTKLSPFKVGHFLVGFVPNFMFETTHVNSLFEIPENKLSKINKAFAPGNWLINIEFTGYFAIFDKHLKKILWTKKFNEYGFVFHDLQFDKNGNLIVFVNDTNASQGEKFSRIVYIDPLKEYPENLVREIVLKNNQKNIFQRVCVGYQELDDFSYLVSLYTDNKGFQLAKFDKNNKEVLRFTPVPHKLKPIGDTFQEGKLVDIGDYLKNIDR